MIATAKELTTPLPCPDPDRLRDYLRGSLDRDAFVDTGRHLAVCGQCRDRAVGMEAEDSFAAQFQATGDDEFLAEADMAAALFSVAMPRNQADGLSAVLPPVDSIGPYDLVRPLGRGGMGTVYLARHRHLDRVCAIKLLPHRAARDDDARGRFEREMKSLASVEHPGIVAATDAGSDGGWFYLVMEYVDGIDLDSLLRDQEAFTIAEACQIAVQLCSALSQLHAVGLVHRDIKPSNVMLTREATIKLLDFGLATQDASLSTDHERLTTVGEIVGTLAFASPEQLVGKPTDARSDLYSLGATLYRMIAGYPPHHSFGNQGDGVGGKTGDGGVAAMLMAKAGDSPPRLVSPIEEVPDSLATLVARLLSRNSADRPVDADEVLRSLKPFADQSDLSRLLPKSLPRPGELPLATDELPLAKRNLLSPGNAPIPPTRKNWGWSVAAASAGAMLVAGFLFQMRSDQGTLVVRSDQDDVTVTITPIEDGEAVQPFQMQRGEKETTLRSGRYEVKFEGTVDDVSFSTAKVDIQRGKVAVAKTQSVIVTGRAAVKPDVKAEFDPKLDATFKGKTVRQYIYELERELDIGEIRNATDAIIRVMEPDDFELAKKAFEPARRFGGWTSGGGNPSCEFMDNFLAQVKQMPPACRLVATTHEIKNGNERSRAAALNALTQTDWQELDPDPTSSVLEASERTQQINDLLAAMNEYQASKPPTEDEDFSLYSPAQLEVWNAGHTRTMLLGQTIHRNLPIREIAGIEEILKRKIAGPLKSQNQQWPAVKQCLDKLEEQVIDAIENTEAIDSGRFRSERDLISWFDDAYDVTFEELLAAKELGLELPPASVAMNLLQRFPRDGVEGDQFFQEMFEQSTAEAQTVMADAIVARLARWICRFEAHSDEAVQERYISPRSVNEFREFVKVTMVGKEFIPALSDDSVTRFFASWNTNLDAVRQRTQYPNVLRGSLISLARELTPEMLYEEGRSGGGGFGGGGFGGGEFGGPPSPPSDKARQIVKNFQDDVLSLEAISAPPETRD